MIVWWSAKGQTLFDVTRYDTIFVRDFTAGPMLLEKPNILHLNPVFTVRSEIMSEESVPPGMIIGLCLTRV